MINHVICCMLLWPAELPGARGRFSALVQSLIKGSNISVIVTDFVSPVNSLSLHLALHLEALLLLLLLLLLLIASLHFFERSLTLWLALPQRQQAPTFLLITEILWRHISLSQILFPKDFGSKIRELVRGNLFILKKSPFYASFEAKPPPAVTSGLSAFLRLNSLGVASCLQNGMGRMKLCSSQTKKSWLSNVAREQQYWFVKAHICVDRTVR